MHLRSAVFLFAGILASLPLALCAQTTLDWRTPAEISDYRTTPDYAETVAYLERIAQAAPGQVKIENFGKTGEGRDLKIVIASKDGVFDPAAIHTSGRAILLVQNSIHAGEMDGKDACLALLRDLVVTKTKADLLNKVVFVFIPVYNIDGHERRSAYNRINQNGPEKIGWRGTFANVRIRNGIVPEVEGGFTKYDGEIMSIFDAAEKYKNENVPLIIFSGKEYGTGSSRDWAAKGPYLQGIKAVIA